MIKYQAAPTERHVTYGIHELMRLGANACLSGYGPGVPWYVPHNTSTEQSIFVSETQLPNLRRIQCSKSFEYLQTDSHGGSLL